MRIALDSRVLLSVATHYAYPGELGATASAKARSCALAIGNVGNSCCACAFTATSAPARYSTSDNGPTGCPVEGSDRLPT